MGNGGIKRQGEFVLRCVLFGGDHIQRQADVLGFVPDRIGETARVGEIAGAVTHTAEGIIGGDAAVGRADESVGFKLDPDFGGEAVLFPRGNSAFQGRAGAHWNWGAIACV